MDKSPNDFQANLTPVSESNTHDVARLAKNYRQLVLWVGAQVLFSVAVLMVPLFRYFVFVTVAGIVFYAYRTAESLGSRAAILWAVAMFFPLVNIVTLLALSSKASEVCRANGVEVGLLGPRLS